MDAVEKPRGVKDSRELKIGDRVVRVALLAETLEQSLWRSLGYAYHEVFDTVARFEEIRPAMKALRDVRANHEADTLLHTLCQHVLAHTPPSDAAVAKARGAVPRVLAEEVWRRARPFDKGLDLKDVEALLTEANVADVQWDLDELLKDMMKA